MGSDKSPAAKDLFISMGSTLHVRNFVEGPSSYRRLSGPEVAALVEDVEQGEGRIVGCFEFGAVPSDKKRREFHQLLDAFRATTTVKLAPLDFMVESEDGETLPNINCPPIGHKPPASSRSASANLLMIFLPGF